MSADPLIKRPANNIRPTIGRTSRPTDQAIDSQDFHSRLSATEYTTLVVGEASKIDFVVFWKVTNVGSINRGSLLLYLHPFIQRRCKQRWSAIPAITFNLPGNVSFRRGNKLLSICSSKTDLADGLLMVLVKTRQV